MICKINFNSKYIMDCPEQTSYLIVFFFFSFLKILIDADAAEEQMRRFMRKSTFFIFEN